MSEKTPPSAGSLFIVALLAVICVLGIVPEHQDFRWVATTFLILAWLIGAFNKDRRRHARTAIIVMGIAASLSPVLAEAEFYTGAWLSRLITLASFAILGLMAFGTLFKILFGIGCFCGILFLIGYALENVENERVGSDQVEETIWTDRTEQITQADHPNDTLLSHVHQWRDYSFNTYQERLEVWQSDKEASEKNRNSIKAPRVKTSREYWGKVYQQIAAHDTRIIERVLSSFVTLSSTKGLNEAQLAEVIVSCIQSIPYSLVYRYDCARLPQENPELQQLADDNGCIGPVAYSLLAPMEFMHEFKGDCDTRTVFLFTIFDKLGYKVAILNSDVYGHSMLGISLPASGKYKRYQGINYYFWETTAAGWTLGTMPPDMNQEKHWYVVLAN